MNLSPQGTICSRVRILLLQYIGRASRPRRDGLVVLLDHGKGYFLMRIRILSGWKKIKIKKFFRDLVDIVSGTDAGKHKVTGRPHLWGQPNALQNASLMTTVAPALVILQDVVWARLYLSGRMEKAFTCFLAKADENFAFRALHGTILVDDFPRKMS